MSILNNLGRRLFKPSDSGFDPRFGTRVGDQQPMRDLEVGVIDTEMQPIQPLRAEDIVGRGFYVGESDRTAAGQIIDEINGVRLKTPVFQDGGQDYMRHVPDRAFASAKGIVKGQMNKAKSIEDKTGLPAIFAPIRMAPTGGDFSTMTGEVMLSYAQTAMGVTNKRKLNSAIKKIVPDWKGIDDPNALKAYQNLNTSDRAKIRALMDKDFRGVKGGLSLPEARLAVTDERQLMGRDIGIQNLAEVDASGSVLDGLHPAFEKAQPGRYLGTVDNDSVTAFDILPEFSAKRGITNFDALSNADKAEEAYTIRRSAPVGFFTDEITQMLQDKGVVRGVGNTLLGGGALYGASALAPEDAYAGGVLGAIPVEQDALTDGIGFEPQMGFGDYLQTMGANILDQLVDIRGNVGDGTLYGNQYR